MNRSLTVDVNANLSRFEAGMNQATQRLGKLATDSQQAGDRIASGLDKANAAAGRFVDVSGRLREANGRFASTGNAMLGTINKLVPGLGKFGDMAEQAGSKLSLYVSAPLAYFVKQSVEAYAKLDSLTRGLATVEKNADTLRARLVLLQDVARMPGLNFEGALEGDIRLRTVFNTMLDGEKAARLSERTMRAFGNALASVGKGGSDFREVSNQLTQVLGSGKLQGDELRVISERVPQARSAILQAFGTMDTKLINSKFTAIQIVEAIVTELEKLPKASGGVANAFENMGDMTFRSLAKVGQIIDQIAGLSDIVDRVSDVVTSLIDKFSSLAPTTQKVLLGIGALVIALPPLLALLGTLTTVVLPALKAGFLAISGPIGLVAVAIGATVALIIARWEELKKELLETNLWDTLKDMAQNGLGLITSVFGVFANLLQGDWKNLWEHAKNVVFYAWNGIVDIVAGAVLLIGGHLGRLFTAVGLDGWASKVKNNMNSFFLAKRSLQVDIVSPKANLDLFKGWNFGGGNGKPNPKPGLGDGDSKKVQEVQSTLEVAQAELSKLQKIIDSYNYLKIAVPDEVLNKYKTATDRVNETLAALERLKDFVNKSGIYADIKPIRPKGTGGNDWFEAEGNTGDRNADEREINRVRATQMMQNALAKISNSDKGEVKLPYLDKLAKQAKVVGKQVSENFKEAFDTLQSTIGAGLRDAAQAGLIGMGELIGGLIAGTDSLSQLPQMIGSIFANLAKTMGEALIAFGTAGIAAKAFMSNPVTAIVAGVALVALGSALQASLTKSSNKAFSTPMAAGGTLSGPTNILAGEYPGASSPNRNEWIAPVDIGARKIAQNMMGMTEFRNARAASLPASYNGPASRNGHVSVESITIPNGDIKIALKYANESDRVYGTRRG